MDNLEMMNKPENMPDNRKGKADYGSQDLSAHTFTGKGREAKHSSQMVHEKTEYSSREAEGNFQRALVDRLSEEYQAKVKHESENIDALIAKAREDMERAAKSLDFLAAARYRDRMYELQKIKEEAK